MGSKPAICPPVLRDTLEEDPGTEAPQSSDNDSEGLNTSSSTADKEDEDRQHNNRENTDSNCDDDVKVIVERKPLVPKKRSKDEKIEKAMEKFEKGISTALGSSDEWFIEVQEKRMKLDEMMIKMEHDRMRENEAREERRRKEDREFQLRLISMLSGNNSAPTPPVMMPPSYYYSPGSSSASSHDPMYDWPGNVDT